MTVHYLLISLVFLLLVCIFLLWEKLTLRKAVKSFRWRVTVNGTRGKSSTTTYIAAGLRIAGMRTFGKITGIVPTILDCDGSEVPIVRRGPARVHEQFKMIRLAKKRNAEVIVLECMSLHPEYQRIETAALQPNMYIITNIGEDHFEEMGKKQSDRVASICSAIPRKSLLITIADENLDQVHEIAHERDSSVILCKDFVESHELPDGIFAANINLALTALEVMGVSPEAVKHELIRTSTGRYNPLVVFSCFGKSAYFVNGFAVNDPPTAAKFLQYWRENLPEAQNVHIIFNTRSDRPGRTKLFCQWLCGLNNIGTIIITGTHARAAERMLVSIADRVMVVTGNALELQRRLDEMIINEQGVPLYIGLGNIAGCGFEIIEQMQLKTKDGNA